MGQANFKNVDGPQLVLRFDSQFLAKALKAALFLHRRMSVIPAVFLA